MSAGQWFAAERHECGCEVTVRRSFASSTVTDYECERHRSERIAERAEQVRQSMDLDLAWRAFHA